MFGFDKNLVADFEVRCWRSAFVGGDLVSFLSIGDRRSELLVEFVEVHYEVVGTGRDEVSFRVDGKIRVVAFVGEEG